MFYPVTNSNLATSFHRNESSSGISQEEMQVAIGRARDIENIGYKNQSPQFITEAQRSYSALFWENGNKATTEIFGNDPEVKAGMHYTSLLKKYGKSIAHFLYGKILLASPHIRDFEKKAVKQLEYARQEGCEHADQSLQEMYLVGMGIHDNSSHALEVLTLRAQLRCPASSFQLGLLYLEGKLVAQDNDKALELFKVAVEEKHKDWEQILNVDLPDEIKNFLVEADILSLSNDQYSDETSYDDDEQFEMTSYQLPALEAEAPRSLSEENNSYDSDEYTSYSVSDDEGDFIDEADLHFANYAEAVIQNAAQERQNQYATNGVIATFNAQAPSLADIAKINDFISQNLGALTSADKLVLEPAPGEKNIIEISEGAVDPISFEEFGNKANVEWCMLHCGENKYLLVMADSVQSMLDSGGIYFSEPFTVGSILRGQAMKAVLGIK